MSLFIRGLVASFALAVGGAQAGFVAATYGTAGIDLHQSFARANAEGRTDGNMAALNPIPPPYFGSLNANYDGPDTYAHVEATYRLGPSAVRFDVNRFDRYGPSGVGIGGAWLFSVTESVRTLSSGYLNAVPVGAYSTENYLRATFDDLTAGVRLFQSIQSDNASNANYRLGGLIGNRAASFVGSLENTLVPDHIYRLSFSMDAGSREAGADASSMFGNVTISAVPEPGTFALMLAGLGLVTCVTRRRKQ